MRIIIIIIPSVPGNQMAAVGLNESKQNNAGFSLPNRGHAESGIVR